MRLFALFALLTPLFLCLAGPACTAEMHMVSSGGHDHAGQHGEHAEHEPGQGDHEGSAEGVHALHAWIRATSGKSALLFVDIENGSEIQVKILGAHTDAADSIDLVGFALKDGEPGYDTLPPVPLQPGKKLVLAPSGLALRLNGLKRAFAEGDSFEIEIEFDFGHLEMSVQVQDADATQHSHAGHQH